MFPLFAALVVIADFCTGQWQLRRAAQKEALQSSLQTQTNMALDTAALLNTPDLAQAKDQRGFERLAMAGCSHCVPRQPSMGDETDSGSTRLWC
jgi:cytochrome oxidase assembly protein ShyY1